MSSDTPYSVKEFKALIENPLPEMLDYFEREHRYLFGYRDIRSTLLDVGCGPGRSMSEFSGQVRKIIGVDRDPAMIAAAREATKYSSSKIVLWNEDFLSLYPFSWKQADLVFASYNLPGNHGMTDELRLKLLCQMVRFTKPGGSAIVSFWKPTKCEWLEEYYTRAGIIVREFLPDNVVRTNVGTFKRFMNKEIDDLAIRIGVNYRIIHLTPMWDLVHFFRPKL